MLGATVKPCFYPHKVGMDHFNGLTNIVQIVGQEDDFDGTGFVNVLLEVILGLLPFTPSSVLVCFPLFCASVGRQLENANLLLTMLSFW